MNRNSNKRLLAALLSACLLASAAAGCGDVQPGEASLRKYLRNELPEGVTVSADPGGVNGRERAAAYTGKFVELDPEHTADSLLEYPVKSQDEFNAMGMDYHTAEGNGAEHLYIIDGGKSSGKTSAPLKGGVIYSYGRPDTFAWDTVIVAYPGTSENNLNDYAYVERADFKQKKDLGFLSWEEAFSEVEEFVEPLALPQMEVQAVYTMDLDTMTDHYEQYIEALGEQKGLYPPTGEDEGYLFHLRQVVDGIPLANELWMRDSWEGEAELTTISAEYRKGGVYDFRAKGLVNVEEKQEEKELISATDAVEAAVNWKKDQFGDTEYELFSIELNYIVREWLGEVRLTPAWILGIADEVYHGDRSITEYQFLAVDGFTGEVLKRDRAEDTQRLSSTVVQSILVP